MLSLISTHTFRLSPAKFFAWDMRRVVKRIGHDGKISLALFAFKVDRRDQFSRPGFPHIIRCVALGYKASNFVKKLDVTDVEKNNFEGFDRKSRPRPF